jgi:hypothetical protein
MTITTSARYLLTTAQALRLMMHVVVAVLIGGAAVFLALI